MGIWSIIFPYEGILNTKNSPNLTCVVPKPKLALFWRRPLVSTQFNSWTRETVTYRVTRHLELTINDKSPFGLWVKWLLKKWINLKNTANSVCLVASILIIQCVTSLWARLSVGRLVGWSVCHNFLTSFLSLDLGPWFFHAVQWSNEP